MRVYWNNSDKVVTTTEGSNKLIGAAAAAGSMAAVGTIRLNAWPSPHQSRTFTITGRN